MKLQSKYCCTIYYIILFDIVSRVRLGAGERLRDEAGRGGRGRALVVGLGGGGLPAYLSLRCRLAVQVCPRHPVPAATGIGAGTHCYSGFPNLCNLKTTSGGLKTVHL